MKLKLVDKKKEAENVTTFLFEPEEPITWEAGQFMIYSLPHQNEDIRGRQRFFTISRAPFEKYLSISTRIFPNPPASQARALRAGRSSFKNALNNLKVGNEILAKGPDGDFVIENPKQNSVFLAGGIGITPVRSILLQMDYEHKPMNITLLYSNKTSDFPFKKELDEITAKNQSLKIHYLVNRRIDEKIIKEHVKDLKNSIFYVSGPDGMVDAVTQTLFSMGIPEETIKSDYFSGYD